MSFEDEIDLLESVLRNLETAIGEIQDTPYHSYMASSWEMDLDEVRTRLDELYELQNDQWKQENEAQNLEYERSVL